MPGYVYRGTIFDVPAEPRKKRQGVFNPDSCGTRSGYKQHQRFREPACEKCLAACAEHMAEWRRRQAKPIFDPAKCGTVAGHSQHRNHRVPLCEKCRQANIDDCRDRREKRKKGQGNEDPRHQARVLEIEAD